MTETVIPSIAILLDNLESNLHAINHGLLEMWTVNEGKNLMSYDMYQHFTLFQMGT
jgi:hypothetical protein